MSLSLIVAIRSLDSAIGRKDTNEMIWDCPEDLRFFREKTVGDGNNAVIMGRKTHQSINGLLPKRVNYIVGSRFYKKLKGGRYYKSLEKAIFHAQKQNFDKIFIIGGGEIYKNVLENHTSKLKDAWVTVISANKRLNENTLVYFDFFKFQKLFTVENCNRLSTNANVYYYKVLNLEEKNYLKLVEKILDQGSERNDRTGVGTLAIFGERLEFDLEKGFPLLTTKKMGYKTILKELLWFLSGSTDARVLQRQNVHIWDGNSSRNFLDSRGLNHLPEGDIGALYGYQLRYFGANYVDCETDYTGQGFDQIKYVIDKIKNEPHSRRILFSAWNPADFDKMSIYPCHFSAQFFVDNGKLDCQMHQRSADIMLGVPFNIASYSFLTFMIAHLTGLTPGRLIITFGDTHIYKNHIEGAKEQIKRTPFLFPKLKIKRKITDIDDFKLEDFEITDYKCLSPIKLSMAV